MFKFKGFVRRIVKSRAFRFSVVAVLFVSAFRLKGEALTVTALIARVVEEVAEFFLEGAIHRG